MVNTLLTATCVSIDRFPQDTTKKLEKFLHGNLDESKQLRGVRERTDGLERACLHSGEIAKHGSRFRSEVYPVPNLVEPNLCRGVTDTAPI